MHDSLSSRQLYGLELGAMGSAFDRLGNANSPINITQDLLDQVSRERVSQTRQAQTANSYTFRFSPNEVVEILRLIFSGDQMRSLVNSYQNDIRERNLTNKVIDYIRNNSVSENFYSQGLLDANNFRLLANTSVDGPSEVQTIIHRELVDSMTKIELFRNMVLNDLIGFVEYFRRTVRTDYFQALNADKNNIVSSATDHAAYFFLAYEFRCFNDNLSNVAEQSEKNDYKITSALISFGQYLCSLLRPFSEKIGQFIANENAKNHNWFILMFARDGANFPRHILENFKAHTDLYAASFNNLQMISVQRCNHLDQLLQSRFDLQKVERENNLLRQIEAIRRDNKLLKIRIRIYLRIILRNMVERRVNRENRINVVGAQIFRLVKQRIIKRRNNIVKIQKFFRNFLFKKRLRNCINKKLEKNVLEQQVQRLSSENEALKQSKQLLSNELESLRAQLSLLANGVSFEANQSFSGQLVVDPSVQRSADDFSETSSSLSANSLMNPGLNSRSQSEPTFSNSSHLRLNGSEDLLASDGENLAEDGYVDVQGVISSSNI